MTFKFFPLPEGTAVSRLAVYLHGDQAREWFQDWIFPDVVAWAVPRGVLVIAPLSPVGYSDGDHSYGAAQPREAESVGAAIEQFIAASHTRSDDLLFWSTSGGSWFITSSFLPRIGGRIQGRFALSCGGSTFWQPWAWDVVAEEPRARIHVLLTTAARISSSPARRPHSTISRKLDSTYHYRCTTELLTATTR